ncbi:hypothetical protein NDU88_004418 [Pleurodeles waltl]|uniref:Reverse transcriptase domain-containing protein n=1 Tax=Pleurodeles waltl TaxID=8319 RepID=A0AAV7MUH8_PLEWA|nr:hypothetical protein NDU88_004418 [Pleurodeles waltl]
MQWSIHDAFTGYYTSQYESVVVVTPQDIKSFLELMVHPHVSSDQREEHNENITLHKIQEAIQIQATGKTLDSDRLPLKFYKTYTTLLAPKLKTLYDEAMAASHLPPSLRKTLLISLPKPVRGPEELASYRPMGLLNMDSKIVAKLLADRLAPLVLQQVHLDHNGFLQVINTSLKLR